MRIASLAGAWLAVLLAGGLPGLAAAEEAAATEAAGSHSATDLNKQLSNPVTSLWSIAFQQNNFLIKPGPGEDTRWNSNLNFQPVLPVSINEDWSLITRPVVTLFNSVPYLEQDAFGPEWSRTTAFGDTVLLELVSPSPKLAGDWLLGAGPTLIFPTATSERTGQGKYQAGPAVIVGYLSEKWIAGGFAQQWWSYSGGDRTPVSQMNFQPLAAYFFGEGWSIGYSGNILANWKADGGNVWTVPLGIALGRVQKIGKLPIKWQLGVQYMVVRPDRFGQKWNFQLTLTPVLPKLIQGNLADPSSLSFGMPH